MVKLHLPHMYMIFVDNFKENNHRNPFYDTPDLFSTFGNIRDSLKPFTSKSLGPFQLLQSHFLLFCVFDRRASRESEINVPTIFVPRPMMVVELNQNYLELGEEIHSLWI